MRVVVAMRRRRLARFPCKRELSLVNSVLWSVFAHVTLRTLPSTFFFSSFILCSSRGSL